jgi:hypothetical protein
LVGGETAGPGASFEIGEPRRFKGRFAFTESHPKSLIAPDLSTTPRRALLHPLYPAWNSGPSEYPLAQE